MSINLFTYGVLMYDELLIQLTGKRFTCQPATLPNHQRLTLDKVGWPKIPVVIAENNCTVKGVVIENVDNTSLKILDAFEDTEIDLYRRSKNMAILDSGEEIVVEVYIAGSLAKNSLIKAWNPKEFEEAHIKEYKNEIIPRFLKNRNIR